MLFRALMGGGLLTALVVGCSSPSPDAARSEDGNLIGGAYLKDGDLPSTLLVKDNCTASKVGPRHILLAAHCVWDHTLQPMFQDGKTLQVSSAATVSAATTYQTLTIKHTNVGPEWVEKCTSAESQCMAAGYDNANRASDVALVETVEEIANIPIATIDTTPLQPGEAVIVTGYGCQGSVGGYWSYSSSNLKAGVVQLLPANATIHSGSQVDDQTVSVIAAHDLITPGPAWPTPGPGLCPGDSGGPLYRAKGGGATIVGINGSYTFSGPAGGLPVTNWHTRLDSATARNVGAWLKSVGAATCEGDTCPTRAPATALAAAPPAPEQTATLVDDGRDMSCQKAVNDTSKIQSAIDTVLAANSFCMPLNGQRVSDPASGKYMYGAIAYCWLLGGTTPTADQINGFTAAMTAKGFPNLTYERGVIQGAVFTPACDTFPTGEVACRATLPGVERLVADVKQSSGQKSTCATNGPQIASSLPGFYYTSFACQFDTALDAQYEPYLKASMERLRYQSVSYDAATRTVSGFAISLPCSVFSGGQ